MASPDDDVRSRLCGYEIVAEPSAAVARAEVAEHFPLTDYPVTDAELDAWVDSVTGDDAGPKWRQDYGAKRRRKHLEHCASVGLVGVRKGGTYLDAAAGNSAFSRILPLTLGVARCYRQDARFAPGLKGVALGCSVTAIPLPDANLDGIMAHSAWDRFEGGDATGFLHEAQRLLGPGGKLCILPLTLSKRTEIWTSPSVWDDGEGRSADPPQFDRRAAIVIKEHIGLRQVMRWEPAALAAELATIPGMDFRFHLVVCGSLRKYALVGTRV